MGMLKPCPFCGGKAERVDIDPTDEREPNAGGSYIACLNCYASSKVIFGDKSDLPETWNNRALPPEPRTCETCDQVFDWIKKNTGWSICDPDTGDVDRNGETYRQLFDIVNRKHRSPQSADVETVRKKIELAIKFGLPIDARMALKEALEALDRIAGKNGR